MSGMSEVNSPIPRRTYFKLGCSMTKLKVNLMAFLIIEISLNAYQFFFFFNELQKKYKDLPGPWFMCCLVSGHPQKVWQSTYLPTACGLIPPSIFRYTGVCSGLTEDKRHLHHQDNNLNTGKHCCLGCVVIS